MVELAGLLACDRSNVTGLVGRLEARGLLARVPDQRDRRLKQILLTDAGRKLRAALQERLFAESPATADLEPDERRRLLALLRRLTPEVDEPTDPAPSR